MTGQNSAGVYKCGKPIDYNMPVSIDNPEHDPQINYDILNFNNYIQAMLSLFVAITLEGWNKMMHNGMESGGYAISILFYAVLIIFGAFFALNLVLAQTMEAFYAQQQVDEEEKKNLQNLKIREKEEKKKAALALREANGINLNNKKRKTEINRFN